MESERNGMNNGMEWIIAFHYHVWLAKGIETVIQACCLFCIIKKENENKLTNKELIL